VRPLRKMSPLAEGTARMICSISAGMTGVCLTAIGLIRVVISYTHRDTIADDVLAFDAILFLVATLSAYFSLRPESDTRLHGLERLADVAFLLAMGTLVIVCFIITYMISK
jgi:hypothetical protein